MGLSLCYSFSFQPLCLYDLLSHISWFGASGGLIFAVLLFVAVRCQNSFSEFLCVPYGHLQSDAKQGQVALNCKTLSACFCWNNTSATFFVSQTFAVASAARSMAQSAAAIHSFWIYLKDFKKFGLLRKSNFMVLTTLLWSFPQQLYPNRIQDHLSERVIMSFSSGWYSSHLRFLLVLHRHSWKHYKQSVIKPDWALRTWPGSRYEACQQRDEVGGESLEVSGMKDRKRRGCLSFSKAAFTSTSPPDICRCGEAEELKAVWRGFLAMKSSPGSAFVHLTCQQTYRSIVFEKGWIMWILHAWGLLETWAVVIILSDSRTAKQV